MKIGLQKKYLFFAFTIIIFLCSNKCGTVTISDELYEIKKKEGTLVPFLKKTYEADIPISFEDPKKKEDAIEQISKSDLSEQEEEKITEWLRGPAAPEEPTAEKVPAEKEPVEKKEEILISEEEEAELEEELEMAIERFILSFELISKKIADALGSTKLFIFTNNIITVDREELIVPKNRTKLLNLIQSEIFELKKRYFEGINILDQFVNPRLKKLYKIIKAYDDLGKLKAEIGEKQKEELTEQESKKIAEKAAIVVDSIPDILPEKPKLEDIKKDELIKLIMEMTLDKDLKEKMPDKKDLKLSDAKTPVEKLENQHMKAVYYLMKTIANH